MLDQINLSPPCRWSLWVLQQLCRQVWSPRHQSMCRSHWTRKMFWFRVLNKKTWSCSSKVRIALQEEQHVLMNLRSHFCQRLLELCSSSLSHLLVDRRMRDQPSIHWGPQVTTKSISVRFVTRDVRIVSIPKASSIGSWPRLAAVELTIKST